MPEIKQRIGIMGGTFDPIHIGHLVIAEAVRHEYNLDKVIFVPASQPPHKNGQTVTEVRHRYFMTVMAVCSNPFFYVSTIEIDRPGPSYSIDTVQAFREMYGGKAEFYFITGADAIKDLPTWERIDQLLDLCYFIGTTRPGNLSAVDDVIKYFGEKGKERIFCLATPELEISSTDIRERVKHGKSIKYIVPENVEKYIYKEGLYK